MCVCIYGAPILDVSRSHTTTQHSRYDSSGRVISRRRDPYRKTYDTHNRHISMPPWDSNPRSQQASGLRPLACFCECRVLSGRGLCDDLITRSEESYRLCCVIVCDLETSRIGAPYIYDISNLRVKKEACR